MAVEDDVHLVSVHIAKWVSSREEFDSLGLIGFVQLGGLFFSGVPKARNSASWDPPIPGVMKLGALQ